MAAELAVKENVIEMKIGNASRGPRRLARSRRLAVLLAAVALLATVGAASARADAVWRVTSVHGPTHMPPGGNGQYVIQVYNIGDTGGNSLADLRVDDTLPPGVTATNAFGTQWSCSGVGTGSVSCTYANPLPAPTVGVLPDNDRGLAFPLFVTVSVDAGNSGTADNAVTVSQGDAPSPASTTDPTVFSSTPAGFGLVDGRFQPDYFDAAFPNGGLVRQAGAHPFEARFDLDFNLKLTEDPTLGTYTEPDGHVKNVEVELPDGFVGNPEATPKCTSEQLSEASGSGVRPACPPASQVGSADVMVNNLETIYFGEANSITDLPVYNMVPPKGSVADFAFSIQGGGIVHILASLDPANHYAIKTTIANTLDITPVRSARLTLWGVPADPAHDSLRWDSTKGFDAVFGVAAGVPAKPFLTLPSRCDVADHARATLNSWQHPDRHITYESTPVALGGCSAQQFDASIKAAPTATTTSSPSGLSFDVGIPQDDSVRGLGTPALRKVVVTLPEGMTVSPSSADGLAACSPLQIALGTDLVPTCPDAAKVGTARLETPLLPVPVEGSVYLATQNDNPFGTLLALYIVLRDDERGLLIKLPGKVAPDPVTGQLTATFDDNPALPFSNLHVQFKSGPRAPLSMPPTCGVKTVSAELTSWNASLPPVHATDTFTVGGDCARGFDPRFVAGTRSPLAGKDSPLVTRFTRSDDDEEISSVDVSLPQGVLGRLADLTLCPDAAANAGACGEGARIGSVTVGAGPGPSPFFITDGRVYMTGPYKGAPFGLSIVVHAKAGPLDLGNVVVRAAVFVDRHTAALRIATDPLPTILAGIPLQIRVMDVNVDRPHFTFNPTSCSAKESSATLRSTTGRSSSSSSRFQVAGCSGLPFSPRIAIRVGGRGRTQRGRTTTLEATLRMAPAQANLRGVRVTLPKTINARLNVIEKACTLAEFNAGHCEKARAGTAVAVTPLLRDPLRGNVYFVRNGRPLPDMMVALRGQVDVDLDSRVIIPPSNRLSTSFETIPDVPVTKFVLRIVSGKQGPVGNAANLCTRASRSARMDVAFTAQSGKVIHRTQRLGVRGCPRVKKRR
jgi:hypothetical protein